MYIISRAPGSRQNSPTEADQSVSHNSVQKMATASMSGSTVSAIDSVTGMLPSSGMGMHMNSLSLDVPQFEIMGYDPFQAMYQNHLMQAPMESPNFGMDYGQQVFVFLPVFAIVLGVGLVVVLKEYICIIFLRHRAVLFYLLEDRL